jgi:predicted transcriptional regulator
MSEPEALQSPMVSDFMSTALFCVGVDDDLSEVDRLLQKHAVSALVVQSSDGTPLGVISRTDLLRVAVASQGPPGLQTVELPSQPASAAMTEEIVSVSLHETLKSAASLLAKHSIHRVFVERKGELLGVVSTRDILRAVVSVRLKTPIEQAMTTAIVSVRSHETMSVAANKIAAAHKRGVVVLEDEWPVGILTAEEILLAQHWPAHTAVEEWMVPRVLCLPKGMALHRAAAHALAMNVRHVLAMDDVGLVGIVTPIDVAQAFASSAPS